MLLGLSRVGNSCRIGDEARPWVDLGRLAPAIARVRAKTFACVQMGWPVPDGCAAAAYPDFDY